MNVYQVNLKIVRRSLIYKLYVLLISFSFCFLINARAVDPTMNAINYSIDLLDLSYLEIVIFILSFCMAVYFSRMSFVLEQSCCLQKYIILSRFITVVLSSLIVTLLPITYAVIQSSNQAQPALFLCLSVIWVVLKWPIIILFSESLGFFVGSTSQNVLSYLVVIPATLLCSYLNEDLFRIIPGLDSNEKECFSSLLSLQDPFPRGMSLDYVGARVDILSVVHAAFFVFISIALIAITIWHSTKLEKRKIAFRAIAAVACVFVILSAIFYKTLFPVRYNSSEKLFYDAKGDCVIKSIDGDIALNTTSGVRCTVGIKKEKNEPIEFRLDSAFDNIKVMYNNAALNFSREGDFVTISDPEVLTLTEMELHIEYSGRVYYVSNTDNIDIFTSKWYSALPPGYAFLPSNVNRKNDTLYCLNVSSANELASNLDVEKTGTASYRLSGTTNALCLFSGFLSSKVINGITCVYSISNTRTDFSKLLNEVMNSEKVLAINNGKLDILDTYDLSSIRKVMMIYYFYNSGGFPVLFDDYIIVNYGYTT